MPPKDFATANASANALEEYDAASATVAFAANEISKTITVAVKGDTKVEGQEVFYVNLSDASGGFIS